VQIIRRLLERKGYEIWSVPPEGSVYEALELMAAKRIGAVLVIRDGEVVGIFSERDYARKVILMGRASRETRVEEIMTPDVIYADGGDTIEECMARMTARRVRHLPVLDGGELVGVISIGDLVKSIISEQKFIIEQLEQYISR
jgi:CBS domain-containing protein